MLVGVMCIVTILLQVSGRKPKSSTNLNVDLMMGIKEKSGDHQNLNSDHQIRKLLMSLLSKNLDQPTDQATNTAIS